MSFLKKLLGGTFDDHFERGVSLFDAGEFGEAKLSLERALSKAKGAASGPVARARDLVRTCKIALARGKISDADATASSGDLESAVALLKDAREICAEPEILEAIQDRLKGYEAEDSRRLVEDAEEISEEELMTIIAGTWTDAQADEYAALPETFTTALIAAHDGDLDRAVEILEDIAGSPDLSGSPRYLLFELGKVLLMSQRPDRALERLDAFMALVDDDDDAREVRVTACDLRAGALVALERFDDAAEALRRATDIAPEDHTVFLKLGVFLRSRERYDASVGALEKARELMGQMHPDFTVIRELGFTYLAMDRKKDAMDCFKSVLEHLASRGEHSQFDPDTAVALARLHEERGEPMQAADIYRHLAVGYDTRHHFTYNLEAARLLQAARGSRDLVERYTARARELARTDEETAMVDALIQ